MRQTERCIVAIEVGGTNTQHTLVDESLEMRDEVHAFPSQEHATADEHIKRFSTIIRDGVQAATERGLSVAAASLAFPGRCDYDAGVPLLQHKYASLYGLPFASRLQEETGIKVAMLNDAGAFALGAVHKDEALIEKIKLLPPLDQWITVHPIGTGLGSKVVDLRGGITVNEFEIFDSPYLGGELEEDYISARGIVKAYRRITGTDQPITPEDIAQLAYMGDSPAITTYTEFGNHLGNGLPEAYGGLRPELIAIGGKISRSVSLFGATAIRAYRAATHRERATLHHVSDERTALYGAAIHGFSHLGVKAAWYPIDRNSLAL